MAHDVVGLLHHSVDLFLLFATVMGMPEEVEMALRINFSA